MKKFCFVVILFCLFPFIISCSLKEKTPKHELNSFEIAYSEEWLHSNLYEIGLGNYNLGKYVEGTFDSEFATKKHAYLFYDNTESYHNTYLAVETENKVLFKRLSESYSDELSVADIDGDKIDEIIVQSTVGMSGGAGSYLSRVFKVSENGIMEIFSSSTGALFDTGFNSRLEKNYKMVIQNRFTEYETTVDTEEKYLNIYYDKVGNVINSESIWCDSFRTFLPKDMDNDGIFEIICVQYVSLNGHSDYIGDAESVIKFNSEIGMFEVIQASFQPI